MTRPGRVIPKTQKWYLMLPCLTLSVIRYGSRVKWSNPGIGVAPFPTPRCSSYWKVTLWVTLDNGRQLYWLTNHMHNHLTLCELLKLTFHSGKRIKNWPTLTEENDTCALFRVEKTLLGAFGIEKGVKKGR